MNGTVTLTMNVIGSFNTVSDDVILTIDPEATAIAGKDATVCFESPYLLSAMSGNGIIAWSSSGDGIFDDPGQEGPVYTFGSGDIQSGKVTLTLTVSGNCNSTVDEVDLVLDPKDCSFIIYEALSPNGDGLNDFWMIKGIEFYPNNVVRVFDRWNNFVFEAVGYNNNNIVWTGQANKSLSKSLVGDGTYFYIIIIGDGTPQLSGKITLKR
jgi:gliding motility-associated-like protein